MTTQTPPLDSTQTQTVMKQAAKIAKAATSSVGSNTFVFFAAFDGTNNGGNPPADGSGDATDDGGYIQLYDQVLPDGVPVRFIGGAYEEGVGTPGSLFLSSAWDQNVTGTIHDICGGCLQSVCPANF